MKKYIKIIFFSLTLCLLNELYVSAQNITTEYEYMCVSPEKAILSALIAVGIGIAGFVWRHRKRL